MNWRLYSPPPPFRPKTKTKQTAIDGLQSTTFLSWRKPADTLQKQLRGSKPFTTRIMMMQSQNNNCDGSHKTKLVEIYAIWR